MVAFIGAVICIIAAVHTGSSRATAAQQQPASDNHSLFSDVVSQTPAAGGSAARAGSLGALHGSETPDALSFGVGGPDGVITGLTGHDPAVSRLICTPIPAGDCNPKNFQQQAEDPSLYAGEDWGYLRTTAEELRQTVLQQKDQILTDKRTIRELTGKLTECEKGLERRGGGGGGGGGGSPAAGLWSGGAAAEGGAHLERIMVRDSPASSPESQHLLTARAVDELEQAITQLKDRIEKLESDIGPFPHNLTVGAAEEGAVERTAAAAAAQLGHRGGGRQGDGGGGGGGERPWRMEELEGELERKVELLEKERKALRQETERHRQEIDQGISQLQHRIAGLEDAGVSDLSFPDGYRISFPTRTNYMFAVVQQSVPRLRALTLCLWLRPTEGGIGTPLSYAVAEQPNELVLLQGLHTPTELLINDKVAQLPLNLSRGSWQHVCVSWSQKGGAWQAYQGGKLRGEGHSLATGHHVRPGGVLVLGQEQDSLGGGFDSSQALVGELSQVGLWDRVLSAGQVSSLARCGRVAQGNVAPWTAGEVKVHGGARKEPGEPCAKHSRSSQ